MDFGSLTSAFILGGAIVVCLKLVLYMNYEVDVFIQFVLSLKPCSVRVAYQSVCVVLFFK